MNTPLSLLQLCSAQLFHTITSSRTQTSLLWIKFGRSCSASLVDRAPEAHVWVCMVYGHICVQVHACRGQMTILGVLSCHSPPHSHETGTLLKPEAGLTTSKTQRSSCSAGVTRLALPYFSYGWQVFELGFLCLLLPTEQSCWPCKPLILKLDQTVEKLQNKLSPA